MFPERPPLSVTHSPAVLAKVRGVDLLERQIGYWPDFCDFEVHSITLDRPSQSEAVSCDLRAVFYVFDIRTLLGSPARRPALLEMLFHDVDEVKIVGFNHQNPIMGLGLQIVNCDRLATERMLVTWGGTCMSHDVSFRCNSITVVRVIDLDPFQRGL